MKLPVCKKCGSDQIQVIGKRNALYPMGCLYVLGPLFASLHQLQSPVDFRRNGCGRQMGRRTLFSKVALVLVIGMILAMIGFAVVAVFSSPD